MICTNRLWLVKKPKWRLMVSHRLKKWGEQDTGQGCLQPRNTMTYMYSINNSMWLCIGIKPHFDFSQILWNGCDIGRFCHTDTHASSQNFLTLCKIHQHPNNTWKNLKYQNVVWIFMLQQIIVPYFLKLNILAISINLKKYFSKTNVCVKKHGVSFSDEPWGAVHCTWPKITILFHYRHGCHNIIGTRKISFCISHFNILTCRYTFSPLCYKNVTTKL